MNYVGWIWESPTWPALTFDATRLAQPLGRARQAVGELIGKATTVGSDQRHLLEQDLWSMDAVATAAIEGETIDLEAVRSSVARRLGIAPLGAAVSGNVEGLLDVMENAADHWHDPLTTSRLCAWQAALFPGGPGIRNNMVGDYRSGIDPMQVVSGPHDRQTVRYEAVAGGSVRAEMNSFLEWFNTKTSMDGWVRAGFAHVWFESIHPFEDGNGRVGRAIIDLALAQDPLGSSRLLGISAAMSSRQASYYDALNVAQRGDGDVTTWREWFFDITIDACRRSTVLIEEALQRARFWTTHRAQALNEMQRLVLDRMLEAGPGRFEGGLTARKYIALAKTTKVTASRHLADLVDKGLIVRAPGPSGRSTRYDLTLAGWEWQPPGIARR